jgi:uncharacterized membrane protein YkvA (DUF1232 family)
MPNPGLSAFAGASLLLDRGKRDQMRLAWRLLRDERVTGLKYSLPALLLIYLLSPVDLLPDFLLGFGQIDDMGVAIGMIVLSLRLLPRLAPATVVDEHLRDMGQSIVSRPRERAASEQAFETSFRVRER